MNDTASRWILVTGGSRGIGRGLVEHFSRDHRVIFTYQHSADRANAVVDALRAQGRDVSAFRCDGGDPVETAAFGQMCVKEYGAPWALIHNAGITRDGLMVSMDNTSWRDVLATNLDACFYLTRAFLESMMAERSGAILMMSSVTGLKGNKGQVNYGASKAAMSGMVRSMAQELSRFGISVNAIAPGLIDTEMAERMTDKARKDMQSAIPMRRLGSVDEVARLARYLVSPEAAYITGQTIVIDGGLTA
ncbi:3-oxoacyl-ACP reductase FabG [Nitrogeniibacter aestuarii]|uniref:3-oxoacyl-ACP reductase FabG n=1 Tax=Nitrogeniibacter aestuarii TaxID=2815343 RepID=UPI001D12AF41|nr:3-oxoacyl-ACP reductase FabG [Nitrogeniibacter aestuarii]